MNTESINPVRLLHISDIHFGCRDDSGSQPRVLEALIAAVSKDALKINCVVFTGDLAQSGEPSEFQQGQDWLVSLCDGLKTDCVIVPGNHDVQRSRAKEKELRSAYNDQDAFGRWKTDIYKDSPHLNAYLEWFRQLKGEFPLFLNNWDTNPAIDVVELKTQSGYCNFICLNTALLSCGDDDAMKLCVDIKALNSALKGWISETSFVLAVGHHPIDHLAVWNRTEVEKILAQLSGPHVYLHGHLHDLQHQSEYSSSGAGYFRAAAGAAYPGATYPKQFSILDLDSRNQKIHTKVFVFNESGGDWVVDNKLSHPVPARLPTGQKLQMGENLENSKNGGQVSQKKWHNPFSDVISNGIPPEAVHRLFVERSDSLTKLRNPTETIVEGQRGTGKTMLLRYFSFEVQSSLISATKLNNSLVNSMNDEQTPFGVYCCLTNAGLNRSDFDAIDGDARRIALFSHIAYLFITNRLFSALQTLGEQDAQCLAGIDSVLSTYTLQLLRLPTSHSTLSGVDLCRAIVDSTDIALTVANEHIASLLPGCQATAFNPWLGLQSNFIGVLERYKKCLGLRAPFFLLIDDFDQLNAEQQSVFFNAAAARRHDVVCFKFGIMSEGQKSSTTAVGRTYREGDDYNYVRLDWVDGGVDADSVTSSYVKTVEDICERRMRLAEWPGTLTLSNLFDNWEHGNKLREEVRTLARAEYEILSTKEKPQTFESFWSKQGNAKYFRHLAKKKIAHRYAGKSTIIDLSSGIFRQFLEICSGVVEVALADGWKPDAGKRIGPEKQNAAVRAWSLAMFRSLGSAGDVSALHRNGQIVTSEHLIRLAQSLSRYFKNRLLSDSKDPEAIAIAIRDPLPLGSFVKCLLDVAVRESVLQRRSVDYSSKSAGGERLPTFILNRRLVPHVGIGAKLQGRHEMTTGQIELAANDVEKFLLLMSKNAAADQGTLL